MRVSHRILKRILKQGFGLTQLKASLTVVVFFFFGGGVHCIYSAEVGAGRQFILRRLSV